MRVICFGAKGMLGSDIASVCAAEHINFRGYDLPDVDITRREDIDRIKADCDWVINCAAYTDVDGAEENRQVARKVNAYGAGYVAEWCNSNDVPLVHISTDYVFDGTATRPYSEDDPVNPVNVYGETKLEGECLVRKACSRHIIVRTQALFGVNGKNFVSTILEQLRGVQTGKTKSISVVDDQFTSPTYTRHLAEAILRLIMCGHYGTVHVSASGVCSWYQFAMAIAEASGICNDVIKPVKSTEYATKARRPLYSVLDKSRLIEWTGKPVQEWRVGLEEFLTEMHKLTTEINRGNLK